MNWNERVSKKSPAMDGPCGFGQTLVFITSHPQAPVSMPPSPATAISPSGLTLCVGTEDGLFRLWKGREGDKMWENPLGFQDQNVEIVSVVGDGKRWVLDGRRRWYYRTNWSEWFHKVVALAGTRSTKDQGLSARPRADVGADRRRRLVIVVTNVIASLTTVKSQKRTLWLPVQNPSSESALHHPNFHSLDLRRIVHRQVVDSATSLDFSSSRCKHQNPR